MPILKFSRHGNLCGCKLLAEAMGCDPRNVRFEFCRTVLMRHWHVDCNHGCHDMPVKVKDGGKWGGAGPIDPIKAILIKNG